jgi:hypothetical protein
MSASTGFDPRTHLTVNKISDQNDSGKKANLRNFNLSTGKFDKIVNLKINLEVDFLVTWSFISWSYGSCPFLLESCPYVPVNHVLQIASGKFYSRHW